MKDKKSFGLELLVFLVGFGLYNLFVFLLTKKYDNVFFSAYIFTTVSFITRFVEVWLFNRASLDDKYLSFTINFVGNFYLIIQLIVGALCMIAPLSLKIALIIQGAILGIYIILVSIFAASKRNITNFDEDIKKETSFIRRLTLEAEYLYLSEADYRKKDELKKLYEAIRYAEPMGSGYEVCELNEEIEIAFSLLRNSVAVEEFDSLRSKTKYIMDLITKRNLICISNNSTQKK